MKQYEAPEMFELGDATELTLGPCQCGEDDSCTGCKKEAGEGDIILA